MLEPEVALLEEVRQQLIRHLDLHEEECDVEVDEQVPAIRGNRYVAVIPGGVTDGPTQATNQGAWDIIMAARVVVFHRIANVARDRVRNVFHDQLDGMNKELSKVIRLLMHNQEVRQAIVDRFQPPITTGQIPVTFRSIQVDPRPTPITFEPWDGASTMGTTQGNAQVGLKRGATFGGLRFMMVRSS